MKKKTRGSQRDSAISLCRRDRLSPWWSWKVCDFDVTGSCDVISPDHFVQGFYYSSFRRCGLNFLVLQKDSKILVHSLSIHKKLERSTHWNIIKKWGNGFTFGSSCTVLSVHRFGLCFMSCRYCKVTNFRPVPIFVLLTWNWFIRTIVLSGAEERGVDVPSLDRSYYSRLQPISFLFFKSVFESRRLACSAHTVCDDARGGGGGIRLI